MNESEKAPSQNARKRYFEDIDAQRCEPVPEAVLAALRWTAPELGVPSTRGQLADKLRNKQEAHFRQKKAEADARREAGLPELPKSRKGEGRNRVPLVDGAIRALVVLAQSAAATTWQREQAIVLLGVIKAPALKRVARYFRSKRFDLGENFEERDSEVWQRVYVFFRSLIESIPTADATAFSDHFDQRIHDPMRTDAKKATRRAETELSGDHIPGISALGDDPMSRGRRGVPTAPVLIEQLPDASLPMNDDGSRTFALEVLERAVRRGKLTEDDRIFFIEQHGLGATHSESAATRNISEAASRQRLLRIGRIVAAEAEGEMQRARKLGLYLPDHQRYTPEKTTAERLAETREAREYAKQCREREKKAACPRTFFVANQKGLKIASLTELTPAQEAIVRELAPRAAEMERFAKEAGIRFEGWRVGMVGDDWEGIRQGIVAAGANETGLFFYDTDSVWHALRYLAAVACDGVSSIENTPISPRHLGLWWEEIERENREARKRERRAEKCRERAAQKAKEAEAAEAVRKASAGVPRHIESVSVSW